MNNPRYSDYSCLEAVDTLISKAQQKYDDLLWDSYGSSDNNETTLANILGQLDHLYKLQEQGIIYEPNF